MNSKVLAAIIFVVVFTFLFGAYLILSGVIMPALDISSTAKKDLEISPSYDKQELKRLNGLEQNNAEMDDQANNDERADSAGLKGVIPTDNIEVQTDNEDREGTENSTEDANKNDSTTDQVNSANSSTSDTLVKKETVKETVNQAEEKPKRIVIPEFTANQRVVDSSQKPEEKRLATLTKELDKFVKKDDQKENKEGVLEKPIPVARVVLKGYSTEESAKIASESIVSMNLNIVPIIKKENGTYKLQLAAFSDKSRAMDLVTKLKSQNYAVSIEE